MAKSTGILRAAKGTFGYFSFHGKLTQPAHRLYYSNGCTPLPNHNLTNTLRVLYTLHAAPDRNGCWLQSSVFVRTACAALGTSPSFVAQPTLLSFIAHQRNFGSRQTHGEKHRNPARGQRNFWLLFLPWKSNTYNVCHKAAISTEILRTPKGTFGYFSFHGKVTLLAYLAEKLQKTFRRRR